MVVIREISKKRFFIAFLLSSSIFIIGLLVGFTLTAQRTGYLENIAYKQKIDYESLQLQSLYLDIVKTNQSCSVFNKILETSLNDVASAQKKVDSYMKESSSTSYVEIKRDYVLAQIRYWLLNKRVTESCTPDNVAILYFYSNENCPECSAQGTILTYLKEKLKDKLLVFSLDTDLKAEPMVDIIKDSYNITEVPSLVIQEKQMSGLVSLKNLSSNICQLYKSKPEYCTTLS